jgi:hypothetical protein
MKAVKTLKKWKAKPPKKSIDNILKFYGGGFTITNQPEKRKAIIKQTLNNVYGKSITKKEGK